MRPLIRKSLDSIPDLQAMTAMRRSLNLKSPVSRFCTFVFFGLVLSSLIVFTNSALAHERWILTPEQIAEWRDPGCSAPRK